MRLAVIALALAVTTTAACGGPERPFELGLKEVPSDLLLGRQTKPPLPLPAQLPPQVFFTDTVGGPIPQTPTTLPPPVPDPPPPPPECPSADPRTPARVPATIDITRPPAPALYRYYTTGFVVGPGGTRHLDPVSTHEVARVLPGATDEFYFDVRVVDAGRVTTTTYHIVPRSSLVVPPGLYISSVDSGGAVPAFEPKPELMLLPFPALPGTTFTAAGSDGATTVAYDGVVTGTVRVDACGTPVDGIEVRLTNGRATTGREQEGTFLAEEFTAAYTIATQYGGLSIQDFLSAALPANPTASARQLTSLISQEPKS